jgi:hypothetical protein
VSYPPPYHPSAAQAQWAQQGHLQAPTNAAHPARGTATAALWLSLMGFFCFPLVPSLLALVLGWSAGRAGYPGGRARAAVVLALIGLACDALLVLVYLGRLVIPG